MNVFQRIRNYFSTHFVSAFVGCLAVMVLLMMMVLQSYLKQEYFQYLSRETYETQNAVLLPMQKSIDNTLSELIARGSEIAIDGSLYQLLQEYEEQETGDAAVSRVLLSMFDSLELHAYSTEAVTVAVAGADGIIAQYDRYRTATIGDFWNEETNSILKEMADKMIYGADAKVFPRLWTDSELDTHKGYHANKIFHVVYPLTGGQESVWKVKYILVISYSMNIFDEFLDAVEIPDMEYIRGYIADSDGNIVYHCNSDYIGASEELETTSSCVTHISKDLKHFGWSLNIIIDEEKMQSHIDQIFARGMVMYVALLIFSVVVIFLVFRNLMRPVGLLSRSMKKVGEGNYQNKVEISGEHEIWQIAKEYNSMIDAIQSKNREIEQQHREKLESTNQKYQAEREALESQINAHFICNTLGCINYEAIEAGNEKVSILLKKLSNILRYTFDQKCQDVYIYQEIAWIDQYLYLQKARLEDVFDYVVDFPEVYGQWPCCKLMFQPFVENSILHGFEGKKSGGRIRLHGEMDGELLKIVIEDNGIGMDDETRKRIEQILEEKRELCLDKKKGFEDNGTRTGIGIRNVITRMRMYYGSRFEAYLETAPGCGTKFTFLIPIPEGIDDEEESEESCEEYISK